MNENLALIVMKGYADRGENVNSFICQFSNFVSIPYPTYYKL